MPWNLFLFPLLGGFLFLHVCNLFRYRSQRFESERLLLHSASYGVVFGIAGRFTTFWLSKSALGHRAAQFQNDLLSAKDAPYLGTAVASLLIGWSLAHLINQLLRGFLGNNRVKLMIVKLYDDGLLQMLYLAMYANKAVSITLSHRKVYIGFVLDPPDSPHDRYLTLMLLLSGYRSEESLRFTETINYADRTILEETIVESQIFTITIPMDNVVSANIFDLDLYEQEFAERLII
jgi:hypothetical protein